jgi:hypothetical protein
MCVPASGSPLRCAYVPQCDVCARERLGAMLSVHARTSLSTLATARAYSYPSVIALIGSNISGICLLNVCLLHVLLAQAYCTFYLHCLWSVNVVFIVTCLILGRCVLLQRAGTLQNHSARSSFEHWKRIPMDRKRSCSESSTQGIPQRYHCDRS